YFAANSGAGGTGPKELFRWDGVNPPQQISANDINPAHMVEFQGKIYFSADTGAGSELHVYDPGTGTVSQVADLRPGTGSTSPQYLAVVGDKLYFSSNATGT